MGVNYSNKELKSALLVSGQTFNGPVSFQNSILRKRIQFENCVFEDNVIWGDESSFQTCTKAYQDIVFIGCVFMKKVLMEGLDCQGGVYFKGCKFEYESKDKSDFSLSLSFATIKILVEFLDCSFNGGISMNGCKIEKIGCQFVNVTLRSEKCEVDFIAANFAKELLFRDCNICCESIVANCITVSHVLICTSGEPFYIGNEDKNLRSIIHGISGATVIDHYIENQMEYVKTDSGIWYIGDFTEKIVYKANTLFLKSGFDFSFMKVEDKYAIFNSIIECGSFDLSNSKSRNLEIHSSVIKNKYFDCRHVFSDWIIWFSNSIIYADTITFNGLSCKGGLFLKDIRYVHSEQTDENEVDGIDISFSTIGVNLQIENLSIKQNTEKQNTEISKSFYIKLGSSNIGHNVIFNHIGTDNCELIEYNMDRLCSITWQYNNDIENQKVLFSLDQAEFSSCELTDNGTSSEDSLQFLYGFLLKIRPESRDYFKRIYENILRKSGKEKEAAELRKKRMDEDLKSQYGIVYPVVKLLYLSVDYGYSNKRLIIVALSAILIMSFVNFIVIHANCPSYEIGYITCLVKSMADLFAMANVNSNTLALDCQELLPKAYNVLLCVHQIIGFLIVSVLVASLAGVFRTRD